MNNRLARQAAGAVLAVLAMAAGAVHAFQLAPLGSAFEAKLTRESPSKLGRVAGKVGRLLKEPVHEEITQIGFGCPTEPHLLAGDISCKGGDHGFASHYIIYGVRWNDLPPFMLLEGEGKACRQFPSFAPACKVTETVRFSTQPECWYCLFSEAERKAAAHKISGCGRGKGYLRGNVMTRSHFGDLQFLHAMADANDVPPDKTQGKVMDWLEFAWKVSSREIKPQTRLKDIEIPTIREHFGCTEWMVVDLYALGRQPQLLQMIHQVAFGSVLHTVQDSFAHGHVEREAQAPGSTCPASDIPQPPRVLEFHNYAEQDGHKHDARDAREAMVQAAPPQWPLAIEATRRLFELNGQPWSAVQPYLACAFELAPGARPSSPGEVFRRTVSR